MKKRTNATKTENTTSNNSKQLLHSFHCVKHSNHLDFVSFRQPDIDVYTQRISQSAIIATFEENLRWRRQCFNFSWKKTKRCITCTLLALQMLFLSSLKDTGYFTILLNSGCDSTISLFTTPSQGATTIKVTGRPIRWSPQTERIHQESSRQRNLFPWIFASPANSMNIPCNDFR